MDALLQDHAEVDLPGISQAHDGVAVAASDRLEGLTGAGFSEADRPGSTRMSCESSTC
jgi:hypothetical protein